MALDDGRAQVLANLKCLYGCRIEVLTLSLGGTYQAVAMRYDPVSASWTKFLHSKPNSLSSHHATLNLLCETEIELAKLFSANGIGVPFEENMVQILTLRRGERREFGSGSSVGSEFEFIATPGSSIPDEIVPEEPVTEEPVVESTPICDEPELVSQEPGLVSFDWTSWGTSKKDKKKEKKARFAFDDLPTIEEAIAVDTVAEEPKAEDSPTSERQLEALKNDDDLWSPWGSSKRDKKKRSKAAVAHSIFEATPAPEPESEAPPADCDFGWGSFLAKKDKKKQGKKVAVNLPRVEEPEGALVEEELASVESEVALVEEETTPDGLDSSPIEEETPEKYFMEPPEAAEVCEEAAPPKSYEAVEAYEGAAAEPQPEPEECSPEVQPERPIHDDFWGVPIKKYKKKGKSIAVDNLVIEEKTPESKPVADYDGWGSWGSMRKKDRNKGKAHLEIEEPKVDEAPFLAPQSEPLVEADIWGTWGAVSKKDKKKKGKARDASVSPAPETVVKGDIWTFATMKDKKMSLVPESEPAPVGIDWLSIWQPKSSKTATEPPTTTPSLPRGTCPETTTRLPQPVAARNGQTVVLTIRYPNETNNQPRQVMVTLADNTRAAIFDAVSLYLDLNKAMQRTQRQRKLEIKCGAGKNGDVDLSALEESKWPEYLEYFRQYTRLPELTVDVVDC